MFQYDKVTTQSEYDSHAFRPPIWSKQYDDLRRISLVTNIHYYWLLHCGWKLKWNSSYYIFLETGHCLSEACLSGMCLYVSAVCMYSLYMCECNNKYVCSCINRYMYGIAKHSSNMSFETE